MTTGKTIAYTVQTFVGKAMSLLFNMLSRFLIAFLPRSKRLLISWLQSPSTVILEPATWSGWRAKNWCFQTVVLEKSLESPSDSKETKSFNPKGNKSWILTGRTDAEAPVLWLPDAKSWLVGKDPDAGKDWGQEEKRVTEDEVVGCHHRLNGHEFE